MTSSTGNMHNQTHQTISNPSNLAQQSLLHAYCQLDLRLLLGTQFTGIGFAWHHPWMSWLWGWYSGWRGRNCSVWGSWMALQRIRWRNKGRRSVLQTNIFRLPRSKAQGLDCGCPVNFHCIVVTMSRKKLSAEQKNGGQLEVQMPKSLP